MNRASIDYVECPICGKKNHPTDTFHCRECGRDDLCLRHQNEITFLCSECQTQKGKNHAGIYHQKNGRDVPDLFSGKTKSSSSETNKHYSSNFVTSSCPDGTYFETVGDVKWFFTIAGGSASIRMGILKENLSTPRVVITPRILGGAPVVRIASETLILDNGPLILDDSNEREEDIDSRITKNEIDKVEDSVLALIMKYDRDEADGKYDGELVYNPRLGILNESTQCVSKLVISSGVREIGDFALRGLKNLSILSLPAGLLTIGKDSFRDCTNINSVTIPLGVKYIDRGAFSGCDHLTSVSFPESLETIDGAFDGTGLVSVTFPRHATKISGFSHCTNLKSIVFSFESECRTIWGFDDCTNLESIKFPIRLDLLDICGFSDCTRLKSVTLPRHSKVSFFSFSRCSALEEVSIGDDSDIVGAFCRCRNLKSIQFGQRITLNNSFVGSNKYLPFSQKIKIALSLPDSSMNYMIHD